MNQKEPILYMCAIQNILVLFYILNSCPVTIYAGIFFDLSNSERCVQAVYKRNNTSLLIFFFKKKKRTVVRYSIRCYWSAKHRSTGNLDMIFFSCTLKLWTLIAGIIRRKYTHPKIFIGVRRMKKKMITEIFLSLFLSFFLALG